MRFDPRFFQLTILSTLLFVGAMFLHFDVFPLQLALTFTTVLLTQWICTRVFIPHERFEWKSASITGLSLCLLFRSNNLLVIFSAAALGIASKFLFRHQGRHIFNPANFGIVAALLLSGGDGWISPGQWGSSLLSALLFCALGFLVTVKAEVVETTLSFLLFYGGMIFLRAFWLGDPLAIPLHQLTSGSLLLFAFFMISDPKTTPATRMGRFLFTFSVAALAYQLRFAFYIPNAFIYALAAFAPLTLLLDRLFQGTPYSWGKSRAVAVMLPLLFSPLANQFLRSSDFSWENYPAVSRNLLRSAAEIHFTRGTYFLHSQLSL